MEIDEGPVRNRAVPNRSVRIGADSSVWPAAVLRGDDGWVIVGERSSIQDGAVIHTTPVQPTTIGDDCVIGHLVHMECCTIEDVVLIGSGSVVLHRVVVRAGALVGAGALVTNDTEVPSRAMALGVPAKIRHDAVSEGAHAHAVQLYVRNGHRYRAELRRLDG